MIIDEDILKDGIDEVLLAKLIGKHSLEQERYEKLYNYYILWRTAVRTDTILRRLKIALPFRICRVWTRNLKRQ